MREPHLSPSSGGKGGIRSPTKGPDCWAGSLAIWTGKAPGLLVPSCLFLRHRQKWKDTLLPAFFPGWGRRLLWREHRLGIRRPELESRLCGFFGAGALEQPLTTSAKGNESPCRPALQPCRITPCSVGRHSVDFHFFCAGRCWVGVGSVKGAVEGQT